MANAVANQENKQEIAVSERFVNKVLAEFGQNSAGELRITDYQRTLIQGYFISIDRALKSAETKRLQKNKNNSDHKYDNNTPFTWENVNMVALSQDVVHYARIGLDMLQKNHLSAIPFKNNATGKYDVNLMEGYVGIQFIAEKYALDKPLSVTTELVYETDVFKMLKKNKERPYDDYEFDITNPFDRGKVIGGFGYVEYDDKRKNRLVVMSLKDIEKRKPQQASAEFWGGKATRYENGRKKDVELDGWYEEMCLKTLKRFVFNEKNIPRDPQKIDDDYLATKQRQQDIDQLAINEEITDKANKVPLNVDMETGEVIEADYKEVEEQPDIEITDDDSAAEIDFAQQQSFDGPAF